ncbi:MAG: HAD-IIIC family phosphatase [Cyanobacteria bacterium P01_D01_bin.44]
MIQTAFKSIAAKNETALQTTNLTIAATFTAEPLQEILEFWLSQFDLELSVAFAGYSQVFQQLLAPTSLMSQNQTGINLLLIRIEDWARFQLSADASLESEVDKLKTSLERSTQDFIGAMDSARRRSSTPYLIAFCPANPALAQCELYGRLEQAIAEALSPMQGVYLMRSTEIFLQYPVSDFYDENRDRRGHIPYTDLAFAALGTALARKIYALRRPPYKVIALDCDRTLWRGICGEDGPLGVSVDAPFQALQSFMVRCSEAGLLLCLCSKNDEDAVWQVFEQRDDMLLSQDHIVAWRINWDSKAENLRSLADELNLGLDSFIFIDDNPVECSEVQALCPEVLTLELPADPEHIPAFLNHVWPFDTLKVTEADQQRTLLYRQNRERSQFEQDALDFNAFIEGLALDIQVVSPSLEQMPRVAQLTQRTNQFNATTRRRSEAEIQQLCEAQGYGCRAVTVKDRFGDYGLVGVMLFQPQGKTLAVDTFLLSCRVLGRGVEHRMVNSLAEIAAEQGLSTVTLNYQPTPKNLPIANFLNHIGQPDCHADLKNAEAEGSSAEGSPAEGSRYVLPTQVAQELTFQPLAELNTSTPGSSAKPVLREDASVSDAADVMLSHTSQSVLWNHIARELQAPSQIFNAIVAQTRRCRRLGEWEQPRTATEKTLSEIWAEVIRLERVGLKDNFFDLGGTSLLAVTLFTRIESAFGVRLPITTLIEAPTLAALAGVIDRGVDQGAGQGVNQALADAWSPLVTVRASGRKSPLYLVHGGYGDVLGMASIVQHLDDDQPLYTLRGVGLDGEQLPLPTVEAMAAEYVRAIKQNQPAGPYSVAGQCAGGIVAFEIAQQLVAQGDTVAFLGLFDTPHPQIENHFTNRARHYFHKPAYRHAKWDRSYYVFTGRYYLWRLSISLKHHWCELRKLDLSGQLAYVGQYASKLTRSILSKLGIKKPAILASPSKPQSHQADLQPSPQQPSPQQPSRQQQDVQLTAQQTLIKDRFFEIFLRAQAAYIPKLYSGQIDFFLTTQHSYVPKHRPGRLASFRTQPESVGQISDLLFGWDQLVTDDRFLIHPVDSPHGEMLEEPYLQRLGLAVQAAMNQRFSGIELSMAIKR